MRGENPALAAQRACPNRRAHTEYPGGDWDLIGSYEWREKMAKTHDQIRCEHCGYYTIWTRRPVTTSRAGADR